MKKILALVLCLMMITASCAFAESAYPVVDFDPATVEGIEGDFLAIEDLGLAFWCPSMMVSVEVTEDMMAGGAIAYFHTEDDAWRMAIGIAPVTDDAGNLITDVDTLAAYYLSLGSPDAMVVTLNGIDCVMCTFTELATMSICYMLEDGSVLAFNFAPLTEELFVPIAGAMAKSIVPYAAE